MTAVVRMIGGGEGVGEDDDWLNKNDIQSDVETRESRKSNANGPPSSTEIIRLLDT